MLTRNIRWMLFPAILSDKLPSAIVAVLCVSLLRTAHRYASYFKIDTCYFFVGAGGGGAVFLTMLSDLTFSLSGDGLRGNVGFGA